VDGKMENIICLDASTLIDHYRKKIKDKTFFFHLTNTYTGFVLPVTAHYEILLGSNQNQRVFWDNLFADILLIPYQPYLNETAINITLQLKGKRKTIEFKDLLIAATSLHHHYSLATLNEKHFDDIEGLDLITPRSFL
jgi:predicted nucleic acid-binding protein